MKQLNEINIWCKTLKETVQCKKMRYLNKITNNFQSGPIRTIVLVPRENISKIACAQTYIDGHQPDRWAVRLSTSNIAGIIKGGSI